MRQKKGKFLTFIFSLLPGAGHMYMGFMKSGLSLMSIFFFLVFLSSWLDIGPILYILPLVWFYSFFDCMQKSDAKDEDFLLIEDKYLFSLDTLINIDRNIFKKRKLFSGILLLILGAYLLWNSAMNILQGYIPPEIYNIISYHAKAFPKIIIGIGIVALGVWLIVGKKRECELNA